MGALLILWLAAVYLLFAAWVTYKAKPRWLKPLVAIAFLLIPTADAVYGRIKLRQMCAAEGGMHIYGKREGVSGFFHKGEPREEWITKYGFEFVEGEIITGGRITNTRIVKGENGAVRRLVDMPLVSEYELMNRVVPDIQQNYDQMKYVTWIRTDIIVENRNTKEVLGRTTDFNFAGGWAERLVASIYAARGRAGTCEIAGNAWEYSQLDANLIMAVFGRGSREKKS